MINKDERRGESADIIENLLKDYSLDAESVSGNGPYIRWTTSGSSIDLGAFKEENKKDKDR